MASPISIPSQLRAAHPDYTMSQSVGGTVYATTPGGTKIVYKRDELMKLSKSPLSKDRPLNMPEIPGITKNEGKMKPLDPRVPEFKPSLLKEQKENKDKSSDKTQTPSKTQQDDEPDTMFNMDDT
eukprot:CAMPEP_0168595286 /NCGR_PEP_ID=MMETSP0420-20121227/9381_1 /TAXON_ID=498008 /ORGANISM="Pessonella sp." /LENGTH=124 /DNA_ID=CAMNT_0008631723 /DNA_START=22 /DNA_END=396 /DNA_ORIENTATION=-